MRNRPKIVSLDVSPDDRGMIAHCNKFNFKNLNIQRFYKIENHKENFIRAWHAHKKEKKYILILSGAIKISLVKIDKWSQPSKNLKKQNFFLSEKKPQILFIPGGFAHGIQNLTNGTTFIVFSDFSLNKSLNDDYRFPFDYWGDWNIPFR